MFRSLRNLWRLFTLARILARHNALFPFDLIPAAKPVIALAGPLINKKAAGRPGERLSMALQELGPCFIKFGQSLATRSDLIGEAIAPRSIELTRPPALLSKSRCQSHAGR